MRPALLFLSGACSSWAALPGRQQQPQPFQDASPCAGGGWRAARLPRRAAGEGRWRRLRAGSGAPGDFFNSRMVQQDFDR